MTALLTGTSRLWPFPQQSFKTATHTSDGWAERGTRYSFRAWPAGAGPAAMLAMGAIVSCYDAMNRERVRYRWVVGSGVVGMLLVAVAFFTQYGLGATGAPIEALISIGTAFFLAGVLYFL